MKIKNRFLSRLFAGFVVATVIATSTPVSALAADISPASVALEAQEGEAVAESTVDDVEVSDAETDTEKADDKTVETEKAGNTDTGVNTSTSVQPAESTEKDKVVESFFEETIETAQNSLPATTIISEQSAYGPTKIQWRTSATDPFVPNTKAGTVRFVTQNPGSALYSSSYWGGYPSQNECGITCQSMALSYLGVQHLPGDLLSLGGGVSRIGTSYWSSIVGGYDHQGYPGCNGTALKTAINNYLANTQTNPKYSPVFIHLNNYPLLSGYGGSHYLLIIGVVDASQNIYEVLDPWDNNVTRVTLTFGTYPTAKYTAFTTTITDEVDEFYQFTRPSGSAGSVAPVTPDPTPTTPSTGQTFTTVANKDAVVLADEVNIRKSASTAGAIITTVDKYEKVVITAKSTEWYKIKFTLNGVTKTGYIYREFVGVGKRPSTVSFSLKRYYGNRIKISWKEQSGVTGYKVQRYDPVAKKYKTIKKLVGNSKLSYMDTGLTNGTSYKYRVYAYTTWNHADSYTLNSPSPTPKSMTAKNYMIGKTTGTQLNVRKGPGTNYGILKTLSKAGVEVRVYSLTNSWYKIKLQISGVWKTGYITKEFVKI